MSAARAAQQGIHSEQLADRREQIVGMLTRAYWMEMETLMNYVACSVNPDGVRARELIEALERDLEDELTHAKRFAQRIKELHGVVPGSLEFRAEQGFLQPPGNETDLVHVISGVIEAETAAIEHYNRIVDLASEIDWVTQEMTIEILHEEEAHRRLFEGLLREYEHDADRAPARS